MSIVNSARWRHMRTVVPSAAALLGLVSLAVWGHLSHWKLSHESEPGDHDNAHYQAALVSGP
ncbi:MAG: hypothetical protein ABUL64_00990, partial [Singulisphaera sp.]